MTIAPSIQDLKGMSDDDLLRRYDQLAKHTVVGTNFYMDEIRFRDAAKLNRQVVFMTRMITIMTVVITLATIVNVIVFLNDSPTVPGFIQ